MSEWSVNEQSSEKQQLESEMSDYLNGLNQTEEISYPVYSDLFDFSMELLNQMYELGKKDSAKEVTD